MALRHDYSVDYGNVERNFGHLKSLRKLQVTSESDNICNITCPKLLKHTSDFKVR